jgi:hypothetical protein
MNRKGAGLNLGVRQHHNRQTQIEDRDMDRQRVAVLIGSLTPMLIAPAIAQRQGQPQTPQFDAAAVTLYRDSFAIIVQGQVRGWELYAMERTATGFLYRERMFLGPANNGEAEVSLDSQLKPIRAQDTTVVFGKSFGSDVHYSGQHATGFAWLQTDSGPKRIPIDTVLPSGAFDGRALMELVLTLDWHPGAQYALTMFEPDEGIITQRLTVVGEEHITIPSGSRDVFRAELTDLTTTEAPVSIWVTATKPHRIVKVGGATDDFSTVLVAPYP